MHLNSLLDGFLGVFSSQSVWKRPQSVEGGWLRPSNLGKHWIGFVSAWFHIYFHLDFNFSSNTEYHQIWGSVVFVLPVVSYLWQVYASHFSRIPVELVNPNTCIVTCAPYLNSDPKMNVWISVTVVMGRNCVIIIIIIIIIKTSRLFVISTAKRCS